MARQRWPKWRNPERMKPRKASSSHTAGTRANSSSTCHKRRCGHDLLHVLQGLLHFVGIG